MKYQAKGFTLMEVMIVVAIIGILAAIAYPSYQDHLRKGRRASAQSYLLDLANRQEQFLIDNRSYAADATTLVAIPSEVSPFYTVVTAAAGGPPPTYTITATPISGTPQASDVVLTINQVGVKTPSNKW